VVDDYDFDAMFDEPSSVPITDEFISQFSGRLRQQSKTVAQAKKVTKKETKKQKKMNKKERKREKKASQHPTKTGGNNMVFTSSTRQRGYTADGRTTGGGTLDRNLFKNKAFGGAGGTTTHRRHCSAEPRRTVLMFARGKPNPLSTTTTSSLQLTKTIVSQQKVVNAHSIAHDSTEKLNAEQVLSIKTDSSATMTPIGEISLVTDDNDNDKSITVRHTTVSADYDCDEIVDTQGMFGDVDDVLEMDDPFGDDDVDDDDDGVVDHNEQDEAPSSTRLTTAAADYDCDELVDTQDVFGDVDDLLEMDDPFGEDVDDLDNDDNAVVESKDQ
jgi:hypothetical protein